MLDVRTMILVQVVSNLLLAVGLLLVRRRGLSSREMTFWMYGNAAAVLGWALLALRGVIPNFISVVIGNTLIMCMLVLWYRAIAEFRRLRPRLLLPYALMALCFISLWAVLEADVRWRVVVASAYGSALLALNAWVLVVDLPPGRRGLHLATAAVFALCAVVATWRTIHSATVGVSLDLFTPNLVQSLNFAAFYLGSVGVSFCFILLTKERADEELMRLAMYDPLTELLNRRTMLDHFGREFERCRRNRLPVSVLMVDVDHFKQVNDTHGHAAGDKVLKRFAQLLLELRRELDIVGRYGGEEFCLLLPGTADTGARTLAERIRAASERCRVSWRNQELTFTVSIGVATTGADETLTLEELIGRADAALYEAKRRGRNRTAPALPDTYGRAAL
jgi:diguanylate cyclase (GGDEF)-like protein